MMFSWKEEKAGKIPISFSLTKSAHIREDSPESSHMQFVLLHKNKRHFCLSLTSPVHKRLGSAPAQSHPCSSRVKRGAIIAVVADWGKLAANDSE